MKDSSMFDQLLLDAALSGIAEDAPASQMEAVLRSIAQAMVQADPIRRAVVRDALIRRLRRAGVSCPITLANAVFVPEKPKAAIRSCPPLFPTIEPWPHSVPGNLLLDAMASLLRRFIVLSSAAADAEALWCLHTYVHDIANVSPNLCLSSPEKRCGKTQNLQVLGCLVLRPLHTSNVTVAALMRAIHDYGPTLLIDEADTIFTHGRHAELRGILNAGLYRANAFVLRCRGERNQPTPCSVWCPKAIALIGRLPTTLEDRSIVIPLRRRRPGESVDVLHHDTLDRELEPLRPKAARWALDHPDGLRHHTSSVPETLHDRAQDLWRPLLAVAEIIGANWPDRARRAAIELSGTALEDTSFTLQLLASIRSLFDQEQTDRLSSEAIVQSLADDEDSPWPGPMSPTKAHLARLLAPYGIRPTIVHRSRTQVSRGYFLHDFQDAFARYLPK
jgi:putative DNA primase/helicase